MASAEVLTDALHDREQLVAFLQISPPERVDVQKLVLGRPKTRKAAHISPKPVEIFDDDSRKLAQVVIKMQKLENIICGDVRWELSAPLAHLGVDHQISYLFLLHRPHLPIARTDDETRLRIAAAAELPQQQTALLLPANPFLRTDEHDDTDPSHFDADVVQVVAIPLSPAATDHFTALSESSDAAAFREIIIHAECAALPIIGQALSVVGEHVRDLGIRWSHPHLLEEHDGEHKNFEAHTICLRVIRS
jgi:hypothetical protein